MKYQILGNVKQQLKTFLITKRLVFSVTCPIHYDVLCKDCNNGSFLVERLSKQDKVNTADSAFIFLIIQSQSQWSAECDISSRDFSVSRLFSIF